MDIYSQDTLCRAEQNDAELKTIWLGARFDDNHTGNFNSEVDNDFTRLGVSIGNNTNVKTLFVRAHGINTNVLDMSGFYDEILP